MGTVETKDRLYPPRATYNVQDVYLPLTKEPKNKLSPEENASAIALDTLLTTGKHVKVVDGRLVPRSEDHTPDKTDEDSLSLETASEKAILTHTIYPAYFCTEAGLKKLRGFFPNAPQLNTEEDVRTFFYGVKKEEIDTNRKAFLSVISASRSYSEKRMRESFTASGYQEIPQADLPKRMVMIENPQDLIRVVKMYRQRKHDLKSINPELFTNRGQELFLRIHKDRINSLLASSYADLVALVDQYYGSGSAEKETLSKELSALVKGTHSADGSPLDPKVRTSRTSRMDKYVQGSSDTLNPDNPGYISVIDAELSKLFEELATEEDTPAVPEEEVSGELEPSDERRPLLTPEEGMKSTSAEIMLIWYKKALQAYGVLSEHEFVDADFSRSGPAQDGKWQAVIHPTSTTLAVNFKKQTITIPATYSTELAKALNTLDHELAHVVQCHLAQQLGIPILKIVGAGRTSALHEAGAVEWERQATQEISGLPREVGFAYMRAIQRREQGGSFGECVKAYYDEKIRSNPDSATDADGDVKRDTIRKKFVIEAVNRVMRIFRNHGDFTDVSPHVLDSQTLVYSEQELFRRSAEASGMMKMLLLGRIHPALLVEMHELGLVDLSQVDFPEQRPTQILRDEIVAFARQETPQANSPEGAASPPVIT